MQESLVGKRIKIFFDDGNKVSYKEGILKSIAPSFVVFVSGNGVELIGINRIVRMEEFNDTLPK